MICFLVFFWPSLGGSRAQFLSISQEIPSSQKHIKRVKKPCEKGNVMESVDGKVNLVLRLQVMAVFYN